MNRPESVVRGHFSPAESTGKADGADPPSPTVDELFEALSSRRRRYVLHYLKQLPDSTPAQLADVSAQVAAWELGTLPDALDYDDRKHVHMSLYRFHAPKMDELGLLDYDRENGTVELTEYGREMDVYLETVWGKQIPWSVYFLLLSFGSTLLVFAVSLDVAPLTFLPDAAWAAFVAVTFLISSAWFAYHNRYSMRVGSDGTPPEVQD